MFGIGLPEMIVILAVALIVVGPDKLPDMARTVAKWVLELKKTVNQVKESLADEDSLIGSVQSDLRKTGDELKSELLDSKGKLLESDHFTLYEPGGPKNVDEGEQDDVIDMDTYQTDPLSKDEKSGADADSPDTGEPEPEPESEDEGTPQKPSP